MRTWNPSVAVIGRGLGLDVSSVHEIGRKSLPDEDQLRFAATEDRVFLTRNRNDFLFWTREFFRTAEPHTGVLIIPLSLPNNRPDRIAHALARWASDRQGQVVQSYTIDFLSS